MESLKDKIKHYREKAHMTKSELARRIGVSPSYITMLENGEKENPSLEVKIKLANEFNCSIDDLNDDIDISDDLTKIVNKKYYSNISANDIGSLLNFKKTTFNAETFEKASDKEKEKFINDLSNINPMHLKINKYINNFETFTKEDLIDISNEFIKYGTDLLNCFIEQYHQPKVNRLSNQLTQSLELLHEYNELIKDKDKLIASYKEKLDKITSLINKI